ncbi:MAG TPA: hypothetical protein VK742_07560 [Candidatus Sulfotelmatobacter sp.]|jgi:hypothetical protein|nr:hypothetical protein [Candidatus Sulfotelmatobacter sp.]
MKMTKAIQPSAAPVRALVATESRMKTGGLPTIKEMMKPLVQPFGLIKSRQAAAR